MALDTIRFMTEVDGDRIGRKEWNAPKEQPFIVINDRDNAICFRIQKGPVKEVGVNGVQIDRLFEIGLGILAVLNRKHGCAHNDEAIAHFRRGLRCLRARKKDRMERGVEGTNKK